MVQHEGIFERFLSRRGPRGFLLLAGVRNALEVSLCTFAFKVRPTVPSDEGLVGQKPVTFDLLLGFWIPHYGIAVQLSGVHGVQVHLPHEPGGGPHRTSVPINCADSNMFLPRFRFV